MVKVRSLESVDIYVYVMYYVYATSGPSLLIESTDSMIHTMIPQSSRRKATVTAVDRQ